MTAVSQPRDDTEKRVFLICHRSERSEVKRSRESMDCHALVPYGGARNDVFKHRSRHCEGFSPWQSIKINFTFMISVL
ncbi:MAG: hypothetical protein NC218_11285 [Acetobacter sp.]|nr:hypothetical protein [Acetobacter sp.]